MYKLFPAEQHYILWLDLLPWTTLHFFLELIITLVLCLFSGFLSQTHSPALSLSVIHLFDLVSHIRKPVISIFFSDTSILVASILLLLFVLVAFWAPPSTISWIPCLPLPCFTFAFSGVRQKFLKTYYPASHFMDTWLSFELSLKIIFHVSLR